ncbi:cytochrome P450 [Penicillium soppii]|uniref:cytochrome P450 n=1 Tax=Penicillium soppii TaxID=69789 RepID=UPI00254975D7|nr:cytochrome P450 [Penicillium soppii]KAJ5860069.1 cytochrome P450 [Penicillium soppii]
MPWAFAIVPGILTYLFGLIMYRVRLSPIAAFPGPLLARTTYWYEFYYNWIKCGQYYLKIEEMHQRYGEILL